jgi:hypothetical protein
MTTTKTESLPVSVGYHPAGRDARGFLVARSLPPPDQLPETLAPLAARYTELVEQHRAAGGEIKRLEGEIRRAGDVDVDALADAILEGRGDPGTPATRAAVQALNDARRRRLALERAIGTAWADLESAVREIRTADWERLDQRRAALRERLAAALDETAAVLRELQAAQNVGAWLEHFPTSDWRDVVARVAGAPDPSGHGYRWDQLVNALSDAF